MTTKKLRIGTRGSLLATTQAGHVRDAIIAGGTDAELTIITTPGDVNMAPVERIGVGVFTQALRDAMENDECDLAVHSFKDLPTAPDERFRLIVPVREDNREALIARDGLTLAQLPEGARVGTSAPRRISQLRALRPDLDIRPLRGNIESRMSRVTSGELDAVVLAYAGLVRVGLSGRATQVFDPGELYPAPAQGALAVECRVEDTLAREAIEALLETGAFECAQAERGVLARLQAGCTAPVAAWSTRTADGEIHLRAGVFAVDGSEQLTAEGTGTDPVALGARVADQLLADGAAVVMQK